MSRGHLAFALRLDDAKVIHCIRHAEGEHNVAARDRGSSAYADPSLIDAKLTKRGEGQAKEAGKNIKALGLPIDLIVVSPLRRTLQTATIAFGAREYPMLACELCREAHGLHWSDRRRALHEERADFGHVDFSACESDEDIYWRGDRRELVSEVIARARQFVRFLASLRERNIVVVSHGVFLEMLLGPEVLGAVEPGIMSRRFSNAERRSVIIGAWCPELRRLTAQASDSASSTRSRRSRALDDETSTHRSSSSTRDEKDRTVGSFSSSSSSSRRRPPAEIDATTRAPRESQASSTRSGGGRVRSFRSPTSAAGASVVSSTSITKTSTS